MIKGLVKLFRNLIDVDDLKEDIKRRVLNEVKDRVFDEVEEAISKKVADRIQSDDVAKVVRNNVKNIIATELRPGGALYKRKSVATNPSTFVPVTTKDGSERDPDWDSEYTNPGMDE